MSKSAKVSSGTAQARIRHNIPLYLMFLPGAIYLLINNYIPMAGLVIAFKQVNWNKGILKSPWVGFSNFEYLFKTKEAWNITRNTLGYNIIFIILGTVIAIAVAILLNEITSMMLKKTYQTVILLPYLISMVVVSYLVYAMLSSENGFVNLSILRPLGKQEISWYTESKYWPAILIFVNTWKGIGYGCLIYISAINGIDPTYYEAAELDGAGKLKQIWHITLPCILPSIITLTLLSIGKIFYSDFGLFYQVPRDSGMLYSTTNVIDTYVYRGLMKQGNIGMSSAAGVYQSVVGFVLVLLSNLVVRKVSKENALF